MGGGGAGEFVACTNFFIARAVADQGKGSGSDLPPPYFYIKLRPEGPKIIFLETGAPLISGSG